MQSLDQQKNIDVNKPVENPQLQKAFQVFMSSRTDSNLLHVMDEINNASFLVLILTDEIKTTTDANHINIEKGSVLKFLNCFDKDGNPYLPAFTDWSEIYLWLKEKNDNIGAWIMPASDIFYLANHNEKYHGLVINPGTIGWNMDRTQVLNFLDYINSK